MTLTQFLGFVIAIVLVALLTGCKEQDSSMPLVIFTDTATGCQYVSASGDGITPRMDREGRQVCSR